MTVTEVRQTHGDRYLVTFADGTALKTTFPVVADFSLYPQRELDGEEYEAVVSASGRARCRLRAMEIIGMKAMSERELYDRLVDKGETEENAADSVAYLVSLHLLCDSDYAAMVVRHYAAKGYGPRKIQDELYRRKVPKALWDEAMEELPEQDDTIDRLLRSKLRSDEPDRKELKRATDALLRRGFKWDEIRAAVSRYNSYIEEDY